jgi:hypothetical protein
MKLELKNVKINETFSEETLMFKADLFADGKKIAYAENDGHGGCTWCNAYENQREALAKAEAFALTLPSTFATFGGKDYEFKSSLESWIDDAISKLQDSKELVKLQKKIEKACENYIVWGVPNELSFQKWGFKQKFVLADLYKTIKGKEAIDKLVAKVKADLEPNEVIFNKNIPI